MTRGFYIGRFQPYHDGHQTVVEHIRQDVDDLVVGIGSADSSHSARNPFTAGERVMMVSNALEAFDLRTYVVPIEDVDRHSVWVSHIRSMCPAFEVAYSNNPLVIRLFEEAGIEVRQSPMFDRDRLEGSDIRRRMLEGDSWRDRVPEAVADVVESVDGVARIRQIADTDAPD